MRGHDFFCISIQIILTMTWVTTERKKFRVEEGEYTYKMDEIMKRVDSIPDSTQIKRQRRLLWKKTKGWFCISHGEKSWEKLSVQTTETALWSPLYYFDIPTLITHLVTRSPHSLQLTCPSRDLIKFVMNKFNVVLIVWYQKFIYPESVIEIMKK